MFVQVIVANRKINSMQIVYVLNLLWNDELGYLHQIDLMIINNISKFYQYFALAIGSKEVIHCRNLHWIYTHYKKLDV